MLRILARRASAQVQQYAAISRGFASEAAAAPAPEAATGQPDLTKLTTKDGDLNWDLMSEVIDTESGKRELQQLRSTFLDIDQKLRDLVQEPETINWAQWKKELDPKLVATFQQAYESMPLPEYVDESAKETDAAFAELQTQADELSKHSSIRMKEITDEIASLEAEIKKISTMTVDEVMEAEPKLREQLHAEISQGKFLV